MRSVSNEPAYGNCDPAVSFGLQRGKTRIENHHSGKFYPDLYARTLAGIDFLYCLRADFNFGHRMNHGPVESPAFHPLQEGIRLI